MRCRCSIPRRTPNRHPWFGKSVAVLCLVSLTIISGGFVAGLKAGRIYNTFPMMGEHWIPPGVMALSPGWRNLFDNPALVQLDHRLLAVTTFFVVIAFWLGLQRVTRTSRTSTLQHLLLLALLAQVSLGIATLLLHVPIALAASHQAVAVLLFTSILAVTQSMRDAPPGREAT